MDELLSHTKSLFNYIYWFKQDFEISPIKDHIGTSINWTDISERKEDFLKELVNTISAWVYNKSSVNKIITERLNQTNNDYGNASSFLTTQAFSKFRPGHPQGQFGELLLFNFLQHFFQASPLLRKQRITTSLGHERFGADAIHFKNVGDRNLIFLGESKCYESKYQFNTAFKVSIESIVTTFEKLNSELDLYIYDDFIEPELQEIAVKYKTNTLDNVHFELICLIAFNESKQISGSTENEIKETIKAIILDRCKNIDVTCFSTVKPMVLDRINYIVFPIWELDDLLNSFQSIIGSSK